MPFTIHVVILAQTVVSNKCDKCLKFEYIVGFGPGNVDSVSTDVR